MSNYGVKVIIDKLEIAADGYIPISEENAIQFYCETIFDHFPPIKVYDNILSDFGKLFLVESEDGLNYRRK